MSFDLRNSWWYYIIDNAISECIHFLMRHVFQKQCWYTYISFKWCINQLFHQSIFFSSDFFTYQLHHCSTSTYELHHHYSLTSSWFINLISLSFEPWILRLSLNLTTTSISLRVSSFFLSFSWCCEFWWILVYLIKDIDNFYWIRYIYK